jgi:surface polysaccharide O-acyltransferase-like enzyme
MALIGSVMAWLLPHLDGASVQGVFFMQRLGWVVMAAWGMARLIDGLTRRAGRSPGWLLLAGRESLVMYVAHLLMIHAVPLPALTLDKRLAYSLTLPQVLAVFLLLLVLSWALAWGNEWRKRRAKTMAKEALEAGKG